MRRDKLIKTLKPFVAMASRIPCGMHDTNIISCRIGAADVYCLKVGDIRRVAQLIDDLPKSRKRRLRPGYHGKY